MAHNKKSRTDKTSEWPHELRWRFGQVSHVDGLGSVRPIHGKDIGGDELQRAIEPDIFQEMTGGARTLFVETLEHALHNTAIDSDQILRKKNVSGYDAEPKLFSPDWYKAGEPPQHEGDFLSVTGNSDEIAAPQRYYDHLKPFTPEWYAGETLERCRKLLWFFKAPLNRSPSNFNDIENLLMAALETGRLIAGAEWRQGFKDYVLKYLNSRNTAAKNRDAKNDEKRINKHERQIEVAAIRRKTELQGGALERHIRSRLAEKDFHVSPKTIQRDLKEIEERQKTTIK